MDVISLTDLEGTYRDYEGGLYGGGRNRPPPAHQRAAERQMEMIRPLDDLGEPSEDGTIGMISIGMSNTRMEFERFIEIVDSSEITFVNCALDGVDAAGWVDPSQRYDDTEMSAWKEAEHRLSDEGMSSDQVQLAWLKHSLAFPEQYDGVEGFIESLRDRLVEIVQLAREHFPHLRIVFLSSRTYGGYASTDLNPEPYAYASAFSVQEVIQRQIDGEDNLNDDPNRGPVTAPLLVWGPYLWANGQNGRDIDDLVWLPEDFLEDGTHPSDTGVQKVAELLRDFFADPPFDYPLIR